MKRDKLLDFLRRHKIMVEASSTPDGAPQAAVVGYAVSDALELVFDTLSTTRKFANLRANPRIALVVGWDQVTAQLEGIADFPTGDELERVKACYFEAYPDGRERLAWPGITHVRVRPTWARYTDYTTDPPELWELSGAELG
jgi:pyridoxine/pyridoxamine 5'-phosphate oxidase